MNRNPIHLAVATALLCSLALVGCKKKEEPVPAPVVIETPSAAPAPVSTATAMVTAIDLGNSAGSDMRIAAPMTSFGKMDTIIAAVSTSTSQANATVPGKLAAKWTYQDGQVINEESRDVNLLGDGVTDFQISKPGGWPAGKYKLEISLDGRMVQGKDFEVK